MERYRDIQICINVSYIWFSFRTVFFTGFTVARSFFHIRAVFSTYFIHTYASFYACYILLYNSQKMSRKSRVSSANILSPTKGTEMTHPTDFNFTIFQDILRLLIELIFTFIQIYRRLRIKCYKNDYNTL